MWTSLRALPVGHSEPLERVFCIDGAGRLPLLDAV